MRTQWTTRPLGLLLKFTLLFGCGGTDVDTFQDSGADADDLDGSSGANTFQIRTPDFEVDPGEDATYCYHTTLDVAAAVGVKRWRSTLTPGVHHAVVFLTDTALGEHGSFQQEGCGFSASLSARPSWAYATYRADEQMLLPDGVAMPMAPGQHAQVLLHFVNPSDAAITASVTITAETFTAGESFMPAAPYVTYATDIDVPATSTGSIEHTCDVGTGKNFFSISTHSHRYTTGASLRDGAAVLLSSTDWERPTTMNWLASPHYRFSDKLTYRCEYDNPTSRPVRAGDSEATDEVCMAIGYFFPATEQVLCINDLLVM